ncbi:MAG TPA: ectonucleotide pyrophosphatase/phosphodiesterase [Vicinamibacterales bacterium]
MRRVPIVATLIACAVGAVIAAAQRDPFADLQPTVILISFDGFRWDYTSKAPTPNLRRLMMRGVHARNLIPEFPSKTFPNHYSIATGLYPGHHGIVANNIFDPPTGRLFATTRAEEVRDPMWWGGTPIWTLVERSGVPSATMFWPGSEAPHDGVMPRYWEAYNENKPANARVDQILSWLDLPTAQRPRLLTLYFEDTDAAGHERGPDSQAVRDAIARDDGYIGRLTSGLARRGILDRVNIVVVSDHGMAAVNDDRIIVVDDYISLDDVTISDINPTLGIFPKAGKEDEVYRRLAGANPHLKVYTKADTPERWHYRDHPRVPPILGVADEGWQVLRRASVANIAARTVGGQRGTHGYDPQLMSMRAFFVAAGPAFKRGATVAPFESVSLYNVFAKILGLTPPPNDGEPSVVGALLR